MGQSYKVEELLALRDSVSESAVSIEKFGDEDCIKQHVLRPSTSANGMSMKSDSRRRSLSTNQTSASNSTTATTAASLNCNLSKENLYIMSANKKSSPSPSLKRGKAERLLEEHGSPPGVRVTAGGRVIPADFRPIGGFHHHLHHRHGGRVHGYKLAREQEFTVPHGFIGYDHKGHLCQKIGNALLPVKLINEIPQFYTTPVNSFPALHSRMEPMLPIHHASQLSPIIPGVPVSQMPVSVMQPPFGHVNPVSNPGPTNNHPFGVSQDAILNVEAQIAYLENEYKRLDRERQEFERFEVLKKDMLPHPAREGLINRKREYVLDLDHVRKAIRQLRSVQDSLASAAFNRMKAAPNPGSFVHPVLGPAPQTLFPFYPSVVNSHASQQESLSGPPMAPFSVEGLNKNRFNMNAQLNKTKLSGQYLEIGNAGNSTGGGVNGAVRIDAVPAVGSGSVSSVINVSNGNTIDNGYGKATTENRDLSRMGSAGVTINPVSANWKLEASVPNAKRSRAIEIKDPRTLTTRSTANSSVLDPKSPNYIPIKPSSTFSEKPAAPNVKNDASFTSPNATTNHTGSQVKRKTSNSSVTTSAFFPVNTHEHSCSNQHLPSKSSESNDGADGRPRSRSKDELETPDKEWNNSEWNRSFRSPGSIMSSVNRQCPQGTPIETRISSWNRDCNPIMDHRQSDMIRLHLAHQDTEKSVSRSVGGLSVRSGNTCNSILNNGSLSKKRSQSTFSSPPPAGSEVYFEGYCDGLARKPFTALEKTTDYLDGYAQGLQKSLTKGVKDSSRAVENTITHKSSNGSSVRSVPTLPKLENLHFHKKNASGGVVSHNGINPGSASGGGSSGTHSRMNSEKMGSVNKMMLRDKNDAIRRSSLSWGMNTALDPRLLMGFPTGFGALAAIHKATGVHMFPTAYANPKFAAVETTAIQRTTCVEMKQTANMLGTGGRRTSGSNIIRQIPGNTMYGEGKALMMRQGVKIGSSRAQQDWSSGCDGAMDNNMKNLVFSEKPPKDVLPKNEEGTGATGAEVRKEGVDKKKADSSSGTKLGSPEETKDSGSGLQAGSVTPTSPAKGASSPARAKLEQIANRVKKSERVSVEDDEQKMTHEEKKKSKQNWRTRFVPLKKKEMEDVRRF